MGSTWGAGQRGAGAEFSQGRVEEDRSSAGLSNLRVGQGTRGGRLWERNVLSVCWAPAPPNPQHNDLQGRYDSLQL